MALPGEKFYIDAREIKASGVVTENGFLVFAGSEVRNHLPNQRRTKLMPVEWERGKSKNSLQ